MVNVLYELNFNWIESVPYIIPLFMGMGFFFTFKWYPSQNPGTDQKCSKGYVVAKWVGWIVGAFDFYFLLLHSYLGQNPLRDFWEVISKKQEVISIAT